MPGYPHIQKGLGKLDVALWNRLMAMLKAFEDGKGFSGKPANPPGLKRPYFLAKITDSTLIAGEANRYKYEYEEVVLDTSYGFDERPFNRGREGDDALNLCEMSNTDTHVGAGVDLAGVAYPAGFSMMPIGKCGDGQKIDVLVVMFAVRDAYGGLRSVFSMANDHDGTCT